MGDAGDDFLTGRNFEAWDVREEDFPKDGTSEDKIRFMLRYAILAPSGPNTQPWKFSVQKERVAVHADLSRGLPFVDPVNRTLYMSVGCAIENLLVAAAHFGFRYDIDYFPLGPEEDLVAMIHIEEKGTVDGTAADDVNDAADGTVDDPNLFKEIPRRYTVKDRFEEKKIDDETLYTLKSCVDLGGFYLDMQRDEESKNRLSDLVARSHHDQLSNPDFRRNLGDWLRNNWTTAYDGMPLYTFGVPDAVSLGFPAAFREFDLSDIVIYRDSGLIRGSSAMALLSSDRDDMLSWVQAGMMLQRLDLTASKYDVRLTFFSQPIGHQKIRDELAEMFKRSFPLLLFGLGYGKVQKHTPRRPLEDVIRY